jgi:glutathione synthase/RimK-type ligase-like ATP-grasp enzyme
MESYDLILLTENRFDNPEQRTPYINNVLLEDEILMRSLEKRGLKVARYAWENQDVNWKDTKYILIRTPWNYHSKWDAFFTWFEKTSQYTPFLNPEAIVLWNLDKRYLFDLEKKGVNIAKTRILEKGSDRSLKSAFLELQCEEAVLKPLISAGGRQTFRLNASNIHEHEGILKELLLSEAMMIQEFQKSIPIDGELSLMYFGGKYTHAVLKKAKAGDFRVQDNFDGTVHDHVASAEEKAFAEFTLSKVKPLPIYGRVDIFSDNNGRLALAELELIEPELWFRNHPPAADVFADEILQLLA